MRESSKIPTEMEFVTGCSIGERKLKKKKKEGGKGEKTQNRILWLLALLIICVENNVSLCV